MPTPRLSRLQQVSIREVWPSEPQHFTPWLALPENLSLLADAIGFRLELQSTEEPVGDFRADIVCKSIPDGDLVLVENQFDQTDHTHLGQILTYTAGLEAVTVAWIAERIRDEHRAVIDWLNEKTPENINFFGLEIELWRIADSPVAPKFNVVCKPNQWTRNVVESNRPVTEQSEFRWAYWSAFIQQPVLTAIAACPLRPIRQGNLPFPTSWRDFRLQVYTSQAEQSSAVYLSARGENRFRNFQKLQERREEIERALGAPLSWQYNSHSNPWLVWDFPDLDPTNRDDWPRQQKSLAEKTVQFFRALDPFVRSLEQAHEPLVSEVR